MGIRLFLCGDVMTGRGVDQAFAHSCDSRLRERHVRSARRYLRLAEEAHGPVPAPVEPDYPWGAALDVLEARGPDLRIVNLETAVTTSEEAWRGKGIHYRMHPANVAVLRVAGVDCCVLGNNHVLDWGFPGLEQTLRCLKDAGIAAAGAGKSRDAACEPAVLEAGGRTVRVYSFGTTGAGVPTDWAAREDRPGVCLVPDLSGATARELAAAMAEGSREEDVVVASLHWGSNWGYRIPDRHRRFARVLIDDGGVDVVHGHSSHHPLGMEFHRGRPVLYGCGDFLNDYEGISGREQYRGDLTFMYFVDLSPGDDSRARVEVVPLRIRRFRLERPPEEDRRWLATRMGRECRKLGAALVPGSGGSLELVPGPDGGR